MPSKSGCARLLCRGVHLCLSDLDGAFVDGDVETQHFLQVIEKKWRPLFAITTQANMGVDVCDGERLLGHRPTEQNVDVALRFAHYGYILESGRVVMDGPAEALRENPDVKEFYLGMSDQGRKSFRDVRSYRRRKRWLAGG